MPSLQSIRTIKRLRTGVAAGAVLAAAIAPTQAQDAELAPTFGDSQLEQGFGEHVLTIQAGGEFDAASAGPGCNGFIAEAPDYLIEYLGTGELEIAANSQEDTTILVQDPSGEFLCNDDFDEVNPQVTISGNAFGFTAIWVGTFAPIVNNTYPDADIIVREVAGSDTIAPAVPAPDVATDLPFNAGAEPTFGRLDLIGAEPASLDLQAGGPVEAVIQNVDCAGFVADVPDTVIGHVGGVLQIDVVSETDTTLVVVGPDGLTYCNDDNVDLNPGLRIAGAQAGDYAVFVGTFEPIVDDFYPNATVTAFSGDGGADIPGTFGNARASIEPAFGSITLNAGFGEHSISLQAGGDFEAFELGSDCAGFIAEAPDYVARLDAPAGVRISARSESDTTMAIVAPDGTVFCNDDTEGLNPAITLADGVPGAYAIWVGTFEAGDFPDATLNITEAGSKGSNPSQAAVRTTLTAGFEDDPFTTDLQVGGSMDASALDETCVGFIARDPNFVLSYNAGDWPLRIYVVSDADTTMAVRLPDGSIRCNDDFDGLNPSVAMSVPSSGDYEVFVGTFSQDGGRPNATIAVTELVDQKDLPPDAVTQMTVAAGATRQDFDLLAGGTFLASDFAPTGCPGYVSRAADFTVDVSEGGLDVEVTVRSSEDTTLVVRAPSGSYSCDDDSGGEFHPLVTLSAAERGSYQVWLGTFSSVGHAPAMLSVRDINAASPTPPNVPGGGKK
ncbi:MAG: hypothetical protein AAF739_09990 [Pseudomonadota bacterium]